ncbi:choice-of-anchor B family protein [candidate division KSB1 bacterium]|nr:choice-of-anchor B family protein [candidate division KSB1 bacterium]
MHLSRRVASVFFAITATATFSQYQPGVNNNITLLGHQHEYDSYSNIWGYTDARGNEYALLGTDIGLSIVNITDPANPIEVDFIPGPGPTAWREIKVYNNFAYVVSEATAPVEFTGIQAIDLSTLPDSGSFFYSSHWPNVGTPTTPAHAHSISVDKEGYLYIQGGRATAGTGGVNGGIRIFSLADPLVPIPVGYYSPRYVHDSFVHGHLLFNSNINNGGHIDVLDLTDRANPRLLTQIVYPQGFSHNSGTTEDGNYLITTDEVPGYTVKFWDIRVLWDSDPSNDGDIELVAEYIGDPEQIAHNVHIRGNYAFLSHYVEGVKILDIHDPRDPVEVGYFDTYPDHGEGFAGDWGVFPYFPSGNFVVSDMQTGLYVFKFDTVVAGGVEGRITNRETGALLDNVTVRFVEANKRVSSDANGRYRLRTNAGRHTLVVSRIGFYADTLEIEAPAGATNLQFDIALRPENAFLAVDADTVRATVVPGVSAQKTLTLSNTGTGTLRYSLRDVNGSNTALRPQLPSFQLAKALGQSPLHFATHASAANSQFAANLKQIISDPTGDVFFGARPDITGVLAEKSATAIDLKIKFAHPIDVDSLVVSLALDTDNDPNTEEHSIGIFYNDIGPEYDVIITVPPIPPVGAPARSIIIFDNFRGGAPITRAGAVTVNADSSISATIFLAELRNDDGNMNVVAGAYHFARSINNSPTTFDGAPNNGHGTIGLDPHSDAEWLSETPTAGEIAGFGSQAVTLTFNTTGLEAGVYSALLILNCNDPVNFEKLIPVQLHVDPNTAVQEDRLPLAFALSQNLPNPFHTSTRIEYHLPKASEAELQIFNLQGQLVRTLVSGKLAPGRGVAIWNGLDQRGKLVASGMYFFVLKTPEQKFTRKLVFAR